MRQECTKHSLIAAIVFFGLFLSLDASTVASWGIAMAVLLQILLFLHYDALSAEQLQELQQQLDFGESCVRDHFPESVRSRLQQQHEHESCAKASPIYDVHAEATVFFADLQGFTHWSHQRPPQEVFLLLESLWAACDQLADKHGVQKVETVGDCYVAVAGTGTDADQHQQQHQQQHASRMAAFALEVASRSAQVLSQLEAGSSPPLTGASQLQLRVGLHTGPLVTGVLRGAKRRYQLFGDTVNTASRMESTGCAGRVQISSTTAQCLRKYQQQSQQQPSQQQPQHRFRLTRRQDRVVEAKGLGRVVTYWLEPACVPLLPDKRFSTSGSNKNMLVFLEQLVAQTELQQPQVQPQTQQPLLSRPSLLRLERAQSSVGALPSFPPSPQQRQHMLALHSSSSDSKSTDTLNVSRLRRNLFVASSTRSRSFGDLNTPRF